MNVTVENYKVPFTELIDLAAENVGGRALLANDEFFAEKENLLKPGRGVFIVDKYTENGKWMDGWETRRKRGPGFDWCIVKLGLPGVIRGFNVDTNHFTGNFPEYCSMEACEVEGDPSGDQLVKGKWTEIMPKTRLQGGSQNFIPVAHPGRVTHLRFNIYPDGGVARLRVHGEVRCDWNKIKASGQQVDLAAAMNGGTVVACNDAYFGQKDNLILPGRALTMGGGWETRRKRVPGFDWIVVKLGAAGTPKKIEVDTNHYKGNFPESCSIEGTFLQGREYHPDDFFYNREMTWTEILPRIKLAAHTQHYFEKELMNAKAFTHLRLNIYPDGGISRLRVFGTL